MTTESTLAAHPLISVWATHWSRTRKLAAALAGELALCADHSRVEACTRTAARHGVSHGMAVSARNLLLGIGVVYKHGPHYYKAPSRNGTGG
jgi:hypothetical protein